MAMSTKNKRHMQITLLVMSVNATVVEGVNNGEMEAGVMTIF